MLARSLAHNDVNCMTGRKLTVKVVHDIFFRLDHCEKYRDTSTWCLCCMDMKEGEGGRGDNDPLYSMAAQ